MQVKSCEVFMNAPGDLVVYTSAVSVYTVLYVGFPHLYIMHKRVFPGFPPGSES